MRSSKPARPRARRCSSSSLRLPPARHRNGSVSSCVVFAAHPIASLVQAQKMSVPQKKVDLLAKRKVALAPATIPAHGLLTVAEPPGRGWDGRSVYNALPPITVVVSPLFDDAWFAEEQERAAAAAAAAARVDATPEAALPSIAPSACALVVTVPALLRYPSRLPLR